MNAKKTEENKSLTVAAPAGLPAGYDYGDDDQGAGFENAEAGDFKIPFFNVLQSLSDPVKACRDGSVREGMLYNTVTGVAYPSDMKEKERGILFVPCYFIHTFNEWRPRKLGGGFVGIHQPHDAFVQDAVAAAKAENKPFGKISSPEGNDLIDTYSVYGVSIDEDAFITADGVNWDTYEFEQAVIPHFSTKIGVFKTMLGRKRLMRIPGTSKSFPLYSHVWRVQTKAQSHSEGDSYNIAWNLAFGNAKTGAIESCIPTGSLLFQAVKEFYNLCASGGMTEATEKSLDAQGAAVSEGGNGFRKADAEDVDEEMPF
jgi:hypothetical protein